MKVVFRSILLNSANKSYHPLYYEFICFRRTDSYVVIGWIVIGVVIVFANPNNHFNFERLGAVSWQPNLFILT